MHRDTAGAPRHGHVSPPGPGRAREAPLGLGSDTTVSDSVRITPGTLAFSIQSPSGPTGGAYGGYGMGRGAAGPGRTTAAS